MSTPVDQVNEMIVGHWRSQALYAGAGWACSIIWARVRRNTRNDWPLNST